MSHERPLNLRQSWLFLFDTTTTTTTTRQKLIFSTCLTSDHLLKLFYLFDIFLTLTIIYLFYFPFSSKLFEQFEVINADPYLIQEIKSPFLENRLRDDTDIQYSQFFNNLMLQTAGLVMFVCVSGVLKRKSAFARLMWFNLAGYGIICHTSQLQVIFLVVTVVSNYGLGYFFARKWFFPMITWIYNCALLVFIELNGSYFGKIHPNLEWMDSYRGFLLWNFVPFLILVKCVSYHMDYYWMLKNRPLSRKYYISDNSESSDSHDNKAELTYEVRQELHHPEGDYSLFKFSAYVVYFPLYAAGPIISYNAFLSQVKNPQKTISKKSILMYGLRLILILILKEILAHYVYAKLYGFLIFYENEWEKLDGITLWALSHWMLMVTYIKFLVIWRYYRFFALVDGIETPENLNRCIANNYTISGFWRAWHRSWYLWLVRYMYLPLGGSESTGSLFRKIFNIWLVFTFVVFAHAPKLVNDLKILFWGWSMALFMIPEVVAKWLFSTKYLTPVKQSIFFPYLVSAGGALTVSVLILANLCGYGIVISKTSVKPIEGFYQDLVWKMVTEKDFIFFLMYLFGLTRIMLFVRDVERFSGVHKTY